MTDWSETYRGAVPPWECDLTEHFTIAYYLDRLTDFERNLADLLELGDLLRGGGFHRRFTLRFMRELRAGSSFHIESAALAIDRDLRLGHRFVDFDQRFDRDLGRGALGSLKRDAAAGTP